MEPGRDPDLQDLFPVILFLISVVPEQGDADENGSYCGQKVCYRLCIEQSCEIPETVKQEQQRNIKEALPSKINRI